MITVNSELVLSGCLSAAFDQVMEMKTSVSFQKSFLIKF